MPNFKCPHSILRVCKTRATTKALVAVGVFTTLAACSANLGSQSATLTPPDTNATTAPVGAGVQANKAAKIAMLLPMGGFGRSASIAKSMKQAAEMALFERNQPNIELIVKDDGGSQAGAQTAATQAIADGADIIVGPLFSKAVPGAGMVARQANIPVLALSNDVRVAGNGVYLMSFLVEQEVDRIVQYSISRGKRQFAALIPDTEYGRLVETSFRGSVARHGGSVRILERYPLRSNSMLEPTKKVMATIKRAEQAGLPIEALFVPGGQETLPNLGPILSYSGIDQYNIQMLGTGAWDYPGIGRNQMFVGGWYPGPDPSAWSNFSERFARTFGHTPPRIASLAYDAVSYAISLATESTDQAPYSMANITRLNGYVGVDGLVKLLPNGRPQRSLAILEVQRFGSTVIDTAPTQLGPQTVSSVQY